MAVRRWARVVLTAAMSGAAALGPAMVLPASAAPPPVVTLTPSRGVPGTDYTLSIECPTAPVVSSIFDYDDQMFQDTVVEGPPGTWTEEEVAANLDKSFYVSCDGGQTKV